MDYWKRIEMYYPDLEGYIAVLRAGLPEEEFERYFALLSKFCEDEMTLTRELSWLPTEPATIRKAHSDLLYRLTRICNFKTKLETFDEEIAEDERFLPYPASINAKVLLHSLKERMACPDADVGTLINYTLRNSIYEIIEMALRTKLSYKLEDSGFLKMYINPNGVTLTARDFFDSLPFYRDSMGEVPPQLETCPAVCNFFDKMRVFSFGNDDEEMNE